ncbi:MAG: hypothetical protein JW786_13050 [Desulfobacterales bacterium]|nr:hypothetical protein [Desulfobacterales bacterium]
MTNYQKYRDEFNETLDEGGEISIGLNFSRFPSQILFEMDEVAYNEQLTEYVDQKKAEYSETVYQYFPAPIAYFLYQTNHSFDNEIHRLHLLRSTWESIIYILYALILGEINSNNFSLSLVRIFNNQRIRVDHSGLLNDRLGYKIEFMRKVVDYDQQNHNTLFLSLVLNADIFDNLEELNQERNLFSHIAALSNPEAQIRFDELYPKVMDLLFELDFLENVSLLRFLSNTGAATSVRFNRFNGHSLQRQNYDKIFLPTEITPLLPILNDQLILFELNNIIINCSPFIHFTFEGAHLKLCYFKQVERTTGDFIFELISGTNREVTIQASSLKDCIHSRLGNLV